MAGVVTYYTQMMVSASNAMNEQTAAPNQLDLVIDFVNTLDIDAGSEQLSDPAALATWLSRHGLTDPTGAPAIATSRPPSGCGRRCEGR